MSAHELKEQIDSVYTIVVLTGRHHIILTQTVVINRKMIVLITGFEPYDLGFDQVDENASWEAVKRMNIEELEKKHGVSLIVVYLPVIYNKAQMKISELWQEYQQFDLVIHVGLAKEIQCFQLETTACRGCYEQNDCDGCTPEGFLHPSDGMDSYTSALNLEEVLEEFNAQSTTQITAQLSEDAGKFLCEYVYYTSLYHSEKKKVLFVHVPHEVFSYEQLAHGLENLLELVLKQC